jgi:hypothetical protein
VNEQHTKDASPDAARRNARRVIARATVVFALSAGAVFGQLVVAERALPTPEPLGELAYYPSGTWLTQAALGDATSWSDLLWLRAVQYYGQHRQVDNEFTKMAHVFDIITTLDPRFRSAYVFGGTSLCQEGKQFEAGVRLLEKGMHHNPREWIYPFELGFVHYVGKKDLTRATFDFAQAARQPEAPEFCERFAAWSGQKAGYEAVSFELWRQVAETTDNAYMRVKAIDYLRKLVKGTNQARNLEIWAKSLPPLPGGPPEGEGAGEAPARETRPQVPKGQRVSMGASARGPS